MVTAKRPFQRESGAATIAAILKEDIPKDSLGDAAPPELQRVIEGCVEKSAQQRFQSARDLALTLRAISSSTSVPESLLRRMRKPRKSTIDSIAVLPLENVGDDPESEYLSDGITEGVINRLSQLPKLKVMARSTVFRYKHRDAEPQAVGRDLRVRAVMSGRLQRIGDRLVINVELVDAQDGSAIWGEHYNRQVSDVVKLQEEVSTEIADKLRLKLTGAERKRLQKKATSNSTAYELYLKGRYHWNKRTEESVKRGIVFFREAIEADPSFANAYAGMADSFITLGTNVPLPPREAMPKAKAAAMKAIEIDDGLAEAWASLAAVRWWYDWDWSGAEEAYQRATRMTATPCCSARGDVPTRRSNRSPKRPTSTRCRSSSPSTPAGRTTSLVTTTPPSAASTRRSSSTRTSSRPMAGAAWPSASSDGSARRWKASAAPSTSSASPSSWPWSATPTPSPAIVPRPSAC